MHAVPTPPVEPSKAWCVRGRAVTDTGLVEDAIVKVRGQRFVSVDEADRFPPTDVATAFTWDGLILPGLVDIHCHGGGGVSFPDAASSSAAQIAVDEHRRHGTTTQVASLVTNHPSELLRRLEILSPLAATGEVAGFHLEGPFLNAARCGAQNPALMTRPDADLIAQVSRLAGEHFVSMTLAPELPGAVGPGGVVEAIAQAGAVPSFGHSDASAKEMNLSVADAGAQLRRSTCARSSRPTATHLFNGMRPIHHRDPGPAMACLAAAVRREMAVELVADGVHLDPLTVAFVFDLVGSGQVALVTDAMAATGMADGIYQLGTQTVQVNGGVARLAEGNSIAGSTAHLLDVLRCTVTQSGVDLCDSVRAASATPAAIIGLGDEVGQLARGLRADLVLTDNDLEVQAVFRAGQLV
ncbi:MAG: amidohydrolase family protein [Micrococcales bacterium]|nr:amidohydrolase family protein [Micrococcales bacterium]